jgi:hypothetical protein
LKIVNQSIEVLTKTPYEDAVRLVEEAGRTCYKSESKGTVEGAEKFIKGIIKRGHESVIEHFTITVRVITDRGTTHQIVRHRLASYSQESTRYCNYSKDKFGNEITVIKPSFDEDSLNYKNWKSCCEDSEIAYLHLLGDGATPEQARAVLPTCLKTELVMTMNAREWRHFLKMRLDKAAQKEIRDLAQMILDQFKERYPVFFEDM